MTLGAPSGQGGWPRRSPSGIEVYKIDQAAGIIGWFASSRSRPGAYWKVTWGREGASGPFGMACPCERGQAIATDQGDPWQHGPRVCPHVRAILEVEKGEPAPKIAVPIHPGLRAN